MSLPGTLQTLNEKMLFTPKALYFAVMLTYYSFYLFRAQFIEHYLQLSDSDYGDISALMAFASFAAMTFWSSLADRLGTHKGILIILTLLMAAVFEGAMLIVDIKDSRLRFYLSAAVLSLYAAFWSGLTPLTDYLTLKYLSSKPEFNKDLYGRQVVWGTLSYGFTSYIVGAIVKRDGYPSLFYILPISAVIAAITILLSAPSDRVPAAFTNVKDDEKESIKSVERPTLLSSMGILFANKNYLFMIIVVFLIGCTRAVMTTFLSKYLTRVIGLNSDDVGVAANFGIVFEVMIFIAGPWCILNLGIYWMLILAQMAMVVRGWAYLMIPEDPSSFWLVCAIELLKGVAYGFTQLSGVKVASECAPPGLEATAQAIYGSVYSPLPSIISAFVGGRLLSALGFATLFKTTAIISTIALTLVIIKSLLDGKILEFKSSTSSSFTKVS